MHENASKWSGFTLVFHCSRLVDSRFCRLTGVFSADLTALEPKNLLLPGFFPSRALPLRSLQKAMRLERREKLINQFKKQGNEQLRIDGDFYPYSERR
ncbi:MAG TPA: hypothetical protein VFR58_05700 [Flavisolibacter sp.]|nr:hypothetical protein [Flavisolibacter sp.]